MWPASKLEPSTRTSTPLRGGADYVRLPASRSSIVSIAPARATQSRRVFSWRTGLLHSQQDERQRESSEKTLGWSPLSPKAVAPRVADMKPARGQEEARRRVHGARRRCAVVMVVLATLPSALMLFTASAPAGTADALLSGKVARTRASIVSLARSALATGASVERTPWRTPHEPHDWR
jgi:hypothetical protein